MSHRTCLIALLSLSVAATSLRAAESEDLGNPEKAIKKFSAAVEKAPDDSESWANLGLAYFKMKKLEDAVKAMERSVALNALSAKTQTWLGSIYLELDRGSDAAKAFEAALAADPTWADARANLAQAYYEAGRWDDAIAGYKAMLDPPPASVTPIYTQLGNAYLKKGDVEKAVRWFERTIENSPNDPDAHYNLAVTYRRIATDASGEAVVAMWNKTADQFIKASGMNSGDLKLIFYTAEALASAGRYGEASTWVKRYLAADPDGKKAGAKVHANARTLQKDLANEQ